MARTKADASKKAGGKAPRKAPVLRNTPTRGVTKRSTRNSTGSRNAECKRAVPKWQKSVKDLPWMKAGSSKDQEPDTTQEMICIDDTEDAPDCSSAETMELSEKEECSMDSSVNEEDEIDQKDSEAKDNGNEKNGSNEKELPEKLLNGEKNGHIESAEELLNVDNDKEDKGRSVANDKENYMEAENEEEEQNGHNEEENAGKPLSEKIEEGKNGHIESKSAEEPVIVESEVTKEPMLVIVESEVTKEPMLEEEAGKTSVPDENKERNDDKEDAVINEPGDVNGDVANFEKEADEVVKIPDEGAEKVVTA